MKSIVRRDTGESYNEYLERLAEGGGVNAKGAVALRRMDRKRKKKTSNEDWESPRDGDAEITKLKDGRTALAYKAENAVDMETGPRRCEGIRVNGFAADLLSGFRSFRKAP